MQIPEHIEIRDINQNLQAVLSPQADKIDECWMDRRQNAEALLQFRLPLTSEKWAELVPECRILTNGREFTILKPDAVDITREGEKVWGKVMAHESWKLLDKVFPTISNDPQVTASDLEVTILSGGDAFPDCDPGTAKNAVSYLLDDTDWEVGTVDVPGVHDLETEKESTLSNLQEVQKIWGGIIVWEYVTDSDGKITNRIFHLRPETWQNYTGFQVRYAKNLKHITRTEDNNLVTRLYMFGENDLDISSVNSGDKYVENFQYTNNIYVDVLRDQSIFDAQTLKDKATELVDKLSKPRYLYRVNVTDVRVLPEYQHEEFELHDIADVIDEDIGADDQARIIRHKYNVFQPWKCELEIGEPEERLTSRLKDSFDASKYIKDTLKPNPGTERLLKGILDTYYTVIQGSHGDYELIDGVSNWWDVDEHGNRTGDLLRIAPAGMYLSKDGGLSAVLAITGKGIAAEAIAVGTLVAGMSIESPLITGIDGVFTGKVKVGTGGAIEIDGDNKRIYMDADNFWDETGIHAAAANIIGEITAGQLTVGFAQDNLIPDPNFETDFHLQAGVENSGGAWSHHAHANTYTGTHMLLYELDGMTGTAINTLGNIASSDPLGRPRCVPGEKFYFDIWARGFAVGSGDYARVSCRIQWREEDGTLISANSTGFQTVGSGAGGWTKLSVEGEAPANAAVVTFQIRVEQPASASTRAMVFDCAHARRQLSGVLSAVTGSFRDLMAGTPGGARLEMGELDGDPFLDMFDSNNKKRVELAQDELHFFGEDGSSISKMWATTHDELDLSILMVDAGEMWINTGDSSKGYYLSTQMSDYQFIVNSSTPIWDTGSSLSVGHGIAMDCYDSDIDEFRTRISLSPISNRITFEVLNDGDLLIYLDDSGTYSGNTRPTIRPSDDTYGFVGTAGDRFYQMFASGGFHTSSELSMKRDIMDSDLPACYDMVKGLKFHDYRFKTDVAARGDKATKYIGIIAEEAPAIVCDEAKKNINLYPYISLIGAAVQEMQKRLEKLEGVRS